MKLRGVLSLISIQSTPLTGVSLGLGYASITGTIIQEQFLYLMIAGALGHWTFYSLNDILDYRWDSEGGRSKKPLVGGTINYTEGLYLFILLLAVSSVYSIIVFPWEALIPWTVAYAMGAIYNKRSKEGALAGVYLSVWGFAVILTGALYAGGINGTTVIVGLLLAFHMMWMTAMGNLKDIGKGEVSIPELLDCKVLDKNGYKRLWTSGRFNIFASFLILIQIGLLLLIPVGDGPSASDVIFIYLAIVGAISIWEAFAQVMFQPGFNRDKMKKDIAKFEIVTVASVIIVSLSFMDVNTASFMVIGSILWGVVWQTLLYGHPLRFP